jgi:hypothetical protein
MRVNWCEIEGKRAEKYLSLPGKPVYLVETGTGDTTFEDTEVLFCIYIEGFFIHLVVVC